MAFPSTGGGYQFTDGNINEVKIYPQLAPGATTATSVSLSAAVVTNGLFTSNNTAAVAITLPTVATLEALVINPRVGTAFDFAIINLGSSSGAVTMTTNTGWTLVGSVTVAISTSARFTARKSADNAWVLYRVA
jgi:hypothetical protein